MWSYLASFGAGLATLATPCVLPLVPIYLTILMGGSAEAVAAPQSRGRLVLMTSAFALGFTLVFTALGVGASSLGGALAAHRELLTLAGAALIVLFGLSFTELVRLPWLERDLRLEGPRAVRGPLSSLAFGLVFGLGWTPCAGPVLASVLSLAALDGNRLVGAALLVSYSAGLALPLIAVAGFADRAVPRLRRLGPYLGKLKAATGVVMIGVGLVLGVPAGVALARVDAGPPRAVTTAGEILAPALGAPLPRPRLLEVVEDDCPVCQRMAGRIEELKADCEQHLVDVHAVSLSDERNGALRERLNVRAVPTIVLIDDQGEVRETVVGERSTEELRGLAAALQAATCEGVEPIAPAELEQGEGCGAGEDGAQEECS